ARRVRDRRRRGGRRRVLGTVPSPTPPSGRPPPDHGRGPRDGSLRPGASAGPRRAAPDPLPPDGLRRHRRGPPPPRPPPRRRPRFCPSPETVKTFLVRILRVSDLEG